MYKTLLAAVVLVSVCSIASARPSAKLETVGKDIAIDCKKYPNKDFKISNVSIPNCSEPPCTFKRGEDAKVTFTMESTSDTSITALYAQMCGEISIVCANLQLKDPNLCDAGAKCPINKGDINTVTITIPIASSYPKLTITAYLYTELKNGDTDRGDSDSCFEVEVTLA